MDRPDRSISHCYNAALTKNKQRSKQALESPIFLLGNILDHRFRGQRLTVEQHSIAKRHICDLGLEESFLQYLAKDPPFIPSLFQARNSPYTRWSAGLASGFPSDLGEFAQWLAACEATTASLERLWSTLKHMYGELRTNLGAEKAGKMALVFRYLNPHVKLGHSGNC